MSYIDIPLFRRVTADLLDDTFNALVQDINARFRAWENGLGLPVLVSQIKQGLVANDPGPEFLVADNIPPSPYNSINICWNGTFSLPGDALYMFIQTQLGFSSFQMYEFYLVCGQLPASPS